MKKHYPFESIFVRNRLGQGMTLSICPFTLSADHVCALVAVPKGMHWAVLSKNAEYFVLQLRERFSRTVKKFSMFELRTDDDGNEQWYGWKFNWVSNTPLDANSYLLSQQQSEYYQNIINESSETKNYTIV